MQQPTLSSATPPPVRLVILAIQHVLVMYAGAVAVPLILGAALKLPRDQVALLINADLFACGIATFIQAYGIGPVGIRLPVMMGVTFASLSPMLAMANNPALGLQAIFGSVIAAGVFGIVVAPFISRLLRFFPAVVTGSIITVIGITLMRVGINWIGGGRPQAPDFGAPGYLGVAALVLAVILLLLRFGTGFLRNTAVLIGIVVGYLVTLALGWGSLSGLEAQPWLAVVMPLQFGIPTFDLVACLSMCLVMVVIMIESTGMFLALGTMVGKPVTQDDLARGLRADGVGTLIGGIFNTFPYTSFSQNVGLVGVTGVTSPMVCVVGGVVMLLLGLLPKLAFVAASVPQCVLGGAGVVMFGMVAATGIRILASVDYEKHRGNVFIVAVSIGFGMIPLVAPTLFKAAPEVLKTVLDSGILLASVVAVALNVFFNPGELAADGHAAPVVIADHRGGRPMPLIHHTYGKARVRVMRVHRDGDHNEVRELSVQTMLEGDFGASFTAGDNRTVIATDTIKNIAYIVARENMTACAEVYGQALAARFLQRYQQVEQARISLHETRWTRASFGGAAHPHSFVLDANGKPTVTVVAPRNGSPAVTSGIAGYTFMKSTASGWVDYVMDDYTTLPETTDRIAATAMDAHWTWLTAPADYDATNARVLAVMLEVFANTYSHGVQDSLFRMGEAALAAVPELATIRMACPNKHYLPTRLEPFGLSSDNMVFIATDEPHGQIECVVGR